MKQIIFERDIIMDFGGGWDDIRKSDVRESKDLLISIMMKKYNITEQDLNDISIVKTKLRDVNIDEIIK